MSLLKALVYILKELPIKEKKTSRFFFFNERIARRKKLPLNKSLKGKEEGDDWISVRGGE